MAVLKPFKGYRPPQNIVDKLASKPYDVINSEEARKEANPYSLLHIIKPEIDFDPEVDMYSEKIYNKARENFKKWIDNGWLTQDNKENLYIYAQTWGEHIQYGIVGCASVDDYLNDVVKKHELTRKKKEEDRMKHVRVTNANMEPVFFTYKAREEMDKIIINWAHNHEPVYDFTSDDGMGHKFWVIDDDETINTIVDHFSKIPATYVADGHHRTAAAALVGNEKREHDPNYTGDEEYNYFLAVHFPDNQLKIIDYNRVVKDLNGMSPEEFINKLKDSFTVEEVGKEPFKPQVQHTFGMYLEGKWYKLTAKEGTYDDNDPIGVLDVTVLSNYVLDNVLDIKDLRTSERIDFVGGIRGLKELEKRVDSGEMKVAFSLYPVTLQQLINIADSGEIMPPKTTWFEPKLRSGLVVHSLED